MMAADVLAFIARMREALDDLQAVLDADEVDQ